jgi:hypothetical protein
VFALKLAKPQTKAAGASTSRLAPYRSTLVGQRVGRDPVEQAHLLQRMIGNQATLRLLAQPDPSVTASEPRRQDFQGADPGNRTAHGISWDFSKIPVFPPDRPNHLQTLRPTNPGVVSKLARNPDDSPESPPVSSPKQLDAPAMKEQDASPNSSLRVTSSFAGSNPTFKSYGPGVFCKSPPFTFSGQISVPSARANGDLTVGFMQALLGSTGPKGHYFDANDAPYMTAFQPYAKAPLRDADPGGTFYGPEAQRTVDSPTVSVSMGDAPQAALPWTTPDSKGTLQQVTGEDQYVTWLVTKSDETGKIEPLRYITWNVGWFAAVDQSQPSGTSFDVGKITDAGGGIGPMAPIPSGPVANDSKLPMQWDPWK